MPESSGEPRTVADVLHPQYRWDTDETSFLQGMTWETFRRRLAMGERAEQANYAVTVEQSRAWSWNACLDHIRGG